MSKNVVEFKPKTPTQPVAEAYVSLEELYYSAVSALVTALQPTGCATRFVFGNSKERIAILTFGADHVAKWKWYGTPDDSKDTKVTAYDDDGEYADHVVITAAVRGCQFLKIVKHRVKAEVEA